MFIQLVRACGDASHKLRMATLSIHKAAYEGDYDRVKAAVAQNARSVNSKDEVHHLDTMFDDSDILGRKNTSALGSFWRTLEDRRVSTRSWCRCQCQRRLKLDASYNCRVCR